MNVLYIGRFYPKGILGSIVRDTRGRVGFSNHNFEMSLIRGFAAHSEVNLRVLSAPMVFSYPHNNRHAFIRKEQYIDNGVAVRSIGFCNIVGINFWCETRFLKRAIKKEISFFKNGKIFIVVNTPSVIVSSALFEAINSIKGQRITTVLIVPDVPECMVEMEGKDNLKTRLLRLSNLKNAALSKLYDKYVYLTEAMNDFFDAKPDDYIVMEGLIGADKCTKIVQLADNTNGQSKEIILYSGTLRRIFGVMDLVRVFEKGRFKNCELWICGSGECSSDIAEKAKYNQAIKFFGLVDSQKSLTLQQQATILANPRSSEGNYTRYSFPSKTIEYLLAGKTVIMNRLPGIPSEYDQYLHYPVDESDDAWIEKLSQIFAMDKSDRTRRDKAGREFILKNKQAAIQCEKILRLAAL